MCAKRNEPVWNFVSTQVHNFSSAPHIHREQGLVGLAVQPFATRIGFYHSPSTIKTWWRKYREEAAKLWVRRWATYRASSTLNDLPSSSTSRYPSHPTSESHA